VLHHEGKEVITAYPVLPARETEGDQVAFLYPSQDGHFTHTAVRRDYTGSQVLGVVGLCSGFQVHASFIFAIRRFFAGLALYL
jgi:hypothetical protein